ncbi:hypothetical protein AB0I28_06220 [Phytomonospora sp. NPDC050363]|uniref:hypothetical protein n=1 Tax=Phytomonospora sp. NPDC050363 TaxID=3155642 RepID=UPI00340D29AE
MNDFDFLIGSWTVVNRQLQKHFAGSTEWDEYPATVECRSFFDGGGNFDEIVFPKSRGATLRLFDVETKEWSLYWTNSKGRLFPPVVGTFDGPRGVFEGDDTHEGQPVRARFVWSATDTDSPLWEQYYSADGGRTWEKNWIMEFTRA